MLFSNRDLRKLIIPLVIEQFLAISVGLVDTAMISSVGEAAISGVSLVDMINNLMINIFSAVSAGGAVIVSQYIGHKDLHLARRSAEQLMLLAGFVSVAVGGVCLVFCRGILGLLYGHVEPAVMQASVTYFAVTALSFPCIALYSACAALFRSMGNSRVTMYVSIGMNLLNAVGNAIFIFVFHIGVLGAALSTLLSRAVAAVVMLVLLKDPHRTIFLTLRGIFRFDGALVRRIVFIALPGGVENGIFQLGRVLVVTIIAGFGTAQIAANAVANTLDSIGCVMGNAISLAIVTIIGQCMGARESDQADHYAKKLMKLAYCAHAVINLTLLAALPLLLALYNLSDEAIRVTKTLVYLHAGVGIVLWPASFCLPNVLRAAGDVRFTMAVSVASMVVFRIAFSYLLGQYLGLGAVGVWIAMIIDWACRVTFFVTRFRAGKWKEIRVI